MRVSSKAIYMGENLRNERNDGARNVADTDKDRKNVFAGDLKQNFDPIAQKRKEAQEKAMRVVSDAFENECKIDQDLENRRINIEAQKETILAARKELAYLDEAKVKLQEEFKDIENYEENEDYKAKLNEIEKCAGGFREEIATAEKKVREEIAIIKGVSLERLKTHPILDATKEAEAILESADEQIFRMLIEEGKEKIDEEMEQTKEEAEKQAEEKEVQEEQIEAVKEKVEEMEQFVEGVKKEYVDERETKEMDSSIYEMVELTQQKVDVRAEVENIVDKMKLVIEDIKGACVDQEA